MADINFERVLRYTGHRGEGGVLLWHASSTASFPSANPEQAGYRHAEHRVVADDVIMVRDDLASALTQVGIDVGERQIQLYIGRVAEPAGYMAVKAFYASTGQDMPQDLKGLFEINDVLLPS